MDLSFDQQELRISAPAGDAVGEMRLIDWNGLKARFLAAHALRRELAEVLDARLAGGSFTAASCGVLAANRESSRSVNPNASANGKAPFAIDGSFAGTPGPASEE